MTTRVLAIVQARLRSTRLPGKALLDIAGRPMLAHVLARAAAISNVGATVLATTVNREDDALEELARSMRLPCIRGSTNDVLDRFHSAALGYPAEAIVRISADCPLIDPDVSALVVGEYLSREGKVDYVSNVQPPTFPDGLDTEILSTASLERAWREAKRPSDREHVTTYIRDRPNEFRLHSIVHTPSLAAHRWTVDEPADLEFVRAVYDALAPDGSRVFGMAEVLELLERRPELSMVNAGIRRDEGLERSRLADLTASTGNGP